MINVEELSYTYSTGTTPAVAGISFDIDEGEIFGFLGPSGAGKSTTQKVLIGLLHEFEGDVSVLGRELQAWSSEYYERIGVSFEQPNHFLKLTALENLSYFASLYSGPTEPPAKLLEAVDLAQDAETRVGQFSKGMKNRLTVARALINRPTVLFLDEPTAGLDPLNAQRIKNLIAEQREAGATVFLTTHDMWAADQLCDRVAFIIDGRIELIDSPRELKLRHGSPSVRLELRPETSSTRTVSKRDFELDGLGDNDEFRALLRDRRVETIHSQEATLEKIFIEVTGRRLS